MPADKKATNRANACRSTGPRSAAGKARSAQNALRHGLAVPVMADPDLSREVRDLAQRLGSHHDDGELALAIAEAQVDVGRVRMLRHALIARALKRFGALETVVEIKAGRLLADAAVAIETNKFERAEDLIARAKAMIPPLPDDPSEREVAVLRDLAGQLTKLDRYERRALSRRTGAIRAIDTAQLTRATIVPSQSG